MQFVILLTIFLLSTLFGSAQHDTITFHVQGRVLDSTTQTALPAATITIKDNGAQPVLVTTADSLGHFQFSLKSSGTYRLSVSLVGYHENNRPLTIETKVADLGTIFLRRDAAILKTVVVQSEKALVEQLADRLVYHADRDGTTLGGTAEDVLRNVPMLSVDGNGNVQLRGSSNIRVLINNRPSSIMAVSVADALRQIPADMIKTVEVITSPSAKYDAEGTAGIINIITKKNTLQGVTGSLSIIPGNVSTIGSAGLNYRRRRYGLNFSTGINQFYNKGTTYLERLSYADQSLFIQKGTTRNRSGFVSPRLGFDYAVDDRNSISGGAAFNPSFNQVKNRQAVTNRKGAQAFEEQQLELFNKSNETAYDFNFDYLRTFKDPQQELSILTLYSLLYSDNIANQDAFTRDGALAYQQKNVNQSRNREATLQGDYTHPLKNKTTVELGAKTILRQASSDVQYRDIYPLAGTEVNTQNIFSYDQNVWAAYLSYGFKVWKKMNVKVGSRYEKTAIKAYFKTRDYSFATHYDNLIPSLNASYTFKEKHTLRGGYTRRLQRPQLFFLNPYREVLSPKIIRQGNPELDAELAHLVELGYSTYAKQFSFNANVYARITNNAISSLLSLEKDTTYIRFLNIAANRTYGLSLSGNIKPIKTWSLNGNFNLFYADLQGNGIANQGWMYSFFASSNIDLGKGWWHGFTGSFNSRRVNLQGRMAAFYYHNTTLRKDIFNKRGSLGINLANPLMKGTRVRNNLANAAFEQREDNINYTRGVRLAFSYRFGTLQQAKAPRKAKKAINNDDALRGQ